MIKEGIYRLKEEFLPMLNISKYTFERRKDELLNWLGDFFDFEIQDGKPSYIVIKEQYSEYLPLPKRSIKTREMRVHDYEAFVKANLTKDWSCESKAHMSRRAIEAFGENKYDHKYEKAVTRRYTGPAMEKYGEHTEEKFWAWHVTYEQITDKETLEDWRTILRKHKVSSEHISAAFYVDQEQGNHDKIGLLENYYKNAIDEFVEKYGDFPVYVSKWKLRSAD